MKNLIDNNIMLTFGSQQQIAEAQQQIIETQKSPTQYKNPNNEMSQIYLQNYLLNWIQVQQWNYLQQSQIFNHLISSQASQRINFVNQFPVNQNHSVVTQNLAESQTQIKNYGFIVKDESPMLQFQSVQSGHNDGNSLDFDKEYFVQDTTKEGFSMAKLTIVKEGSLKKELQQILAAIVANIGIENIILVNLRTHILLKKQELTKVFDLLVSKYQQQKKSKEEIIKYIMRKAFKFLFISAQQNSQGKISLKKVTKICLDHYFQDQDIDHQGLVLPFRKNCYIKTMNFSFLEKIFSSSQFVNDYKIFLSKFEEIIIKDNQNKISNIAQNIQKLILEDQLHKIKTMRRMPWTLENLRQVKDVAERLLEQYKFELDSAFKLKKINS